MKDCLYNMLIFKTVFVVETCKLGSRGFLYIYLSCYFKRTMCIYLKHLCSWVTGEVVVNGLHPIG